MRRDIRKVLVLAALATPTAQAQEARTPGTPPPAAVPGAQAKAARPAARPNDARMKQLLAFWEKKSAALKTLDVAISRKDASAVWGKEEYEGRAILKSPDLAWLNFDKVLEDEKTGQKKKVPYERIICTGNEIWQYRSDLKQIFIFPLAKQDRQHTLPEEGPLPFLFGMKAAEAEARYSMTLTREEKDYFVIAIEPRLRIDKESFSRALLKLNRVTYLPDRIFLYSPDGKSTKDFALTEVKPNARVMDENFQGKTIPTWQVIRDPGDQGKAVGVGARVKGAVVRPPQPPLRLR